MASQPRRSKRIHSQLDATPDESQDISGAKKRKVSSTARGKKRRQSSKADCPIAKRKKTNHSDSEFLVPYFVEMPITPKSEVPTPEGLSPIYFTGNFLPRFCESPVVPNAQSTQVEPSAVTIQAQAQRYATSRDNYIEHMLSQSVAPISNDKQFSDASVQCSLPNVRTIGTNTADNENQTAVYISTFDVLDKLFLTNLSHRLNLPAEYVIEQAEDLFSNSFGSDYLNEDIEMHTAETRNFDEISNDSYTVGHDDWDFFPPNPQFNHSHAQTNEDMEISFDVNNDLLFYY